MKLERILLTTDFSACARRAYAPAVELARASATGGDAAIIDLVHVTGHPWGLHLARGVDATALRNVYFEQNDKRLQEEAGHEAFAGTNLEHHLLEGDESTEVATYADTSNADCIVQASHGLGGFQHFLLGSFAERVVRAAHVPVITFKSPPPLKGAHPKDATFAPKSLLLPYDGTPPSLDVLEAVRFFATKFGATVHVAFVWQKLDEFESILPEATRSLLRDAGKLEEETARRASDDLRDFVDRTLADVEHRTHVLVGKPVDALVACAKDQKVDAVFMSTHAPIGLGSFLSGSVTEKVLRQVRCPVLTVHTRSESESSREQTAAPSILTEVSR